MKLRTPRGVKDFLPEDARWKRDLEQSIYQVFDQWGYREVITPTFELFNVIANDESAAGQTYRFLGRNGELLALRSDLTKPIARLVATRMLDQPKPLRLSYLANVFRYDDVQIGFQREFYQAGVELIGSASPAADAEVIALAISAFNALGVKDFNIDIGQVHYLRGIMEDCPDRQTEQLIWDLLLKKDLVGLKEVLQTVQLPEETKKLLFDLPKLRGSESLLTEAYNRSSNASARAAIDNLGQIYRLLQQYGVANQVHLDLSIVKPLDYYTGMVLEGYVPNLGYSLCSGGRYDHLSKEFGGEQPAVGFALGIERLMLALEKQGLRPNNVSTRILVLPQSWKHALEYATQKRTQGVQVEVDTQGLELEQAKAYAQQRQITSIVVVGASGHEIYQVN